MTKRHIIIGAAAAGIGAAHKVRMLDPDTEIIVISDELEDPYNKCLLADYLSGHTSSVQLTTAQKLQEKQITPHFGTRVVAIDTTQKMITLEDQSLLTYDTLCIATGCSPQRLKIPGFGQQHNLCTFYSLSDIAHIDAYITHYKPKRAVVIGAGLSGLECADTLSMRGIAVTVVEKSNHVLAQHIDADASACIEQYMRTAQVDFIASNSVIAVESSEQTITHVQLADGTTLPTDLLICAVGLTPNSGLAEQAGIEVQGGSIITNRFLQTSAPSVYAAGDVALVRSYKSDALVRSSTWPDAMLQGMIAAHGMAGIERAYPGVIPITSSAFFGVKFAACPALKEDVAVQQRIKQGQGSYQKLMLSEQQQLNGFVQVSPTLTLNKLKRAMLMGQKITDHEQLFS